ncbi:hypothetical protein OH76DRAFT_161193 [Lentinus brumalis]|uniref:Uncharacterized protein n=1 Tax=Lentinus brumalis TaxID=2498619 RepID=A0A371DIY0_9APHY|nr:hypothetical protein OH76DRAFT_161193 [Polyporus brumalis]
MFKLLAPSAPSADYPVGSWRLEVGPTWPSRATWIGPAATARSRWVLGRLSACAHCGLALVARWDCPGPVWAGMRRELVSLGGGCHCTVEAAADMRGSAATGRLQSDSGWFALLRASWCVLGAGRGTAAGRSRSLRMRVGNCRFVLPERRVMLDCARRACPCIAASASVSVSRQVPVRVPVQTILAARRASTSSCPARCARPCPGRSSTINIRSGRLTVVNLERSHPISCGRTDSQRAGLGCMHREATGLGLVADMRRRSVRPTPLHTYLLS